MPSGVPIILEKWQEALIILAYPEFRNKIIPYLDIKISKTNLQYKAKKLGLNFHTWGNTPRIGQIFGKLEVLEFSYVKSRMKYWKCICRGECGGNIKNLSTSSLFEGRTNTCGCGQNPFRENSSKWTGFGKISGSTWCSIKHSAKQRNIPFNITIEYGWGLFLKQKGKCALSGKELILAENRYKFNTGHKNASLDRIDSSKGYIEGNVQWVDKFVNLMKRELSQEDFIDICKKTYKNIKGEEYDDKTNDWW